MLSKRVEEAMTRRKKQLEKNSISPVMLAASMSLGAITPCLPVAREEIIVLTSRQMNTLNGESVCHVELISAVR